MSIRRWSRSSLARSWSLLSPLTANAQATAAGVDCGLPESDADALVILNNFYPGYWWDHTNLTVAVQAHPSATEEQLPRPL